MEMIALISVVVLVAGGYALWQKLNNPLGTGKPGLMFFGLLAFVCVLALGNYHVVTGTRIDKLFVPKISWSMSETFVNSDRFMNLPGIVARSEYPLTLAALEQAGLIQTQQERVDEYMKDFTKKMGDVQKEMCKVNPIVC